MPAERFILTGVMAVVFTALPASLAQADADSLSSSSSTTPAVDPFRYDFLGSAPTQVTVANGTVSTTSGIDRSDPFAVVANGSLWQDQQSAHYSRHLLDGLDLTCSTTRTTQDGSPDELSDALSTGATFKPFDALTFQGNLHQSSSDQSLAPVVTSGAGASLETHLPLGSVVQVGVNTEQNHSNANPGLDAATNAYDAQLQKPVGKLPLTLVLKGHYTETDTPGTGPARLPSLEQSLVWKANEATTLQGGLRQQQYQSVPGVNNALNEALFADWSQKVAENVTWHSYAEMLNTRSTVQIAEPGLGANGTPQPNTPNGGNAGVTSVLPVAATDEKLTFSTGPSVKLQKDVSASLEYSNSWDQKPLPGTVGSEQRVSLSLKGTF